MSSLFPTCIARRTVKAFHFTCVALLAMAFALAYGCAPSEDGAQSNDSDVTAFIPIHVAAGYTTGFTDSLGTVWSADKNFTGGVPGLDAGHAVAKTSTPGIYDGQRFGDTSSTNGFAYNFAVPAGNYTVTLKFTENYVTGPGQRLFNVSIDGKQVLTNLDIYAATGGQWNAVDETFPVSLSAAGTINITFSAGSVQSPKVDAIQIIASTTSVDAGFDSAGTHDAGDGAPGPCSGSHYTVAASATNASSTPTGSVCVEPGHPQSFIVTANATYELSPSSPLTVKGDCPVGSWTGNVFDNGVAKQGVYTTGPITANCTVQFYATSAVVAIPAAANIINVLDFGADNKDTCTTASSNQKTNTTAAINNAIMDILNQDGEKQCQQASGPAYDHVVYLPAGVYCINGPIVYGNGVHPCLAFITLQGAGVDQTTIQLDDNIGFTRPVIETANPHDYGNDYDQYGVVGGNDAFDNNINDLTVSTCKGNPRATGISYLANNNGEVRNVRITSGDGTGMVGFDAARSIDGPALVKNLSVSGFTTGVSVGGFSFYTIVFEHLQVTDQQGPGAVGVAVRGGGSTVVIRDLKSSQNVATVPAISSSDPDNLLTLIDSTLTNTAGGGAVDAVANTNNASVFVRNSQQKGYSGLVTGLTCGMECESPAATKVNPDSVETTSLNLPIEETPYYNETNGGTFSSWIDVTTSGCGGGTGVVCATRNNEAIDSAPGINAALHAAPPGTTAFIKQGRYYLNGTIHVPSNVTRVVCYGATFAPQTGPLPAAFQLDSTDRNGLQILEGCKAWVDDHGSLGSGETGGAPVVNNSAGTVVLKDLDGMSYSNTPQSHGGRVFLENMNYGPYDFVDQTVYCRQCDPEFEQVGHHIGVQGGRLWVLGYKQEGLGTGFDVSNGTTTAQVEILGAAIYVGSGSTTTAPLIVNSRAEMSVAGIATIGNGSDYSTWVQETQSGTCASGCDIHGSSSGRMPVVPGKDNNGYHLSKMSLYVGYP